MKQWLRNFVREQRAQDLTEYSLLVAFLALIAIASLFSVGTSVNLIYSDASSKIGGTRSGGGGEGGSGGGTGANAGVPGTGSTPGSGGSGGGAAGSGGSGGGSGSGGQAGNDDPEEGSIGVDPP